MRHIIDAMALRFSAHPSPLGEACGKNQACPVNLTHAEAQHIRFRFWQPPGYARPGLRPAVPGQNRIRAQVRFIRGPRKYSRTRRPTV